MKGDSMTEMISLEEAQALVLANVAPLSTEVVEVLDAVGRVSAADLASDIDIAPFAHSAMDGFAVHAAELESASEDEPVELDVIAEIGAGEVYDGPIEAGQCVRIMTGAPVPDAADAVVKYEIVGVVSGDGKPGSRVSFTAPTKLRNNIREAGEEAHAGEVIVHAGEVISSAGVGFLAGCGVLQVPVYRRPKVAIAATGSELIDPSEVPSAGKIRNSNSLAIAACAKAAGCIPTILPIVEDTYEALEKTVLDAVETYDFVVTTGGAANGDFDFIKPVVEGTGELLMTTVNMRPGKAQTFGIVDGTPVFGLPGNPAAAYMGFELIIRAGLLKMQGRTAFEHPTIVAKLTCDKKKKDPRRLFMRATLSHGESGELLVTPAKNQSSGLFGPIQKTNCMAVLPEGAQDAHAGDEISCVLLDIAEGTVI